jgi:Lipid A 3-O-deacylase (PagL)
MLQYSQHGGREQPRRDTFARLFFAATLLVLSCNGHAQTELTTGYPLLQKGASDVSVRFTEFGVLDYPALVSTVGVRYGKVFTVPFGTGWWRGTVEYTMDALPALVLTKPSLTYCGGIEPVGFRWNLQSRPRLRPYGESAAGTAFCTGNIPPSHFNVGFSVHAGFTRGNQMLTAGLYYSHLSDANLGHPNPNYNGISCVLEYHFMRSR